MMRPLARPSRVSRVRDRRRRRRPPTTASRPPRLWLRDAALRRRSPRGLRLVGGVSAAEQAPSSPPPSRLPCWLGHASLLQEEPTPGTHGCRLTRPTRGRTLPGKAGTKRAFVRHQSGAGGTDPARGGEDVEGGFGRPPRRESGLCPTLRRGRELGGLQLLARRRPSGLPDPVARPRLLRPRAAQRRASWRHRALRKSGGAESTHRVRVTRGGHSRADRSARRFGEAVPASALGGDARAGEGVAVPTSGASLRNWSSLR
jgi:hypothetical protein